MLAIRLVGNRSSSRDVLFAGWPAGWPGDPLTRSGMASPDKKAFLLRVDPALWAEIERLAAMELRSVNGQIEYLLRQALRERLGRDVSQSTTPAAKRKR